MNSYNYIGDSSDKNLDFKKKTRKINQGQNHMIKCNKSTDDFDDKHKRCKSQTLNSLANRKGKSVHEQSIDEISNLLQKQNIKAQVTSYNLVNEYLENPGKISQSKATSLSSISTESKPINRSRGKLEQNGSFISNKN